MSKHCRRDPRQDAREAAALEIGARAQAHPAVEPTKGTTAPAGAEGITAWPA